MSACAVATGNPEPQDLTPVPTADNADALPAVTPAPTKLGELPGEGPYQRFIVKYRDGSVAAQSPAAARAQLEASAVASGLDGAATGQSLQLDWQLRLAVGADVFTTSRPLDRQEAAALMAQFGSDPQVEYIEIDGIVTIQQGSTLPPPEPLGGNL
ncbi:MULTISPECIES: hypothetical protein [unclassified Lysobacter]